jgi:predicted homoserine dehydrogenase-like protein
MVSLDRLLDERALEGRPVNVGLVGSGFMGRAVARRLHGAASGIRLAAIANRTISSALAAVAAAGERSPVVAADAVDLDAAIEAGGVGVTSDATELCRARNVEVIIEATGSVEYGATVALEAFRNGKHVVLMNMTLDATLGPLLNAYAREAGVVYTQTDGDEPGVAMNLIRQVRSMGLRVVAAGNVKGFYDPYRNPETQRAFAAGVGQSPQMVASFADGTKLALEATVLANATGFGVSRRGMVGYRCEHVRDLAGLITPASAIAAPFVDFTIGAEPGSGVFVVAYEDDSDAAGYLRYFKMGEGPLHVFYTPFHLPHLEVAVTAARAALLQDATVAPAGGQVCEAIAVAKRDLHSGDVLDGSGGFDAYALIENAASSIPAGLLPIGLSDGRRLARDIPQDHPIAFSDLEDAEPTLARTLYEAQLERFAVTTVAGRSS